MLGWLFLVALGIVWAIFLFPFIRRRMRSPVTTVEEFEQKMDYLAEANVSSRGRWVLTPRAGARFLGRSGRSRSRVRARRRQVLVLLLEATGLAVLIGLFPPFHKILLGAAALAVLLLIYAVLLVRIRALEDQRARMRRSRSGRMAAYAYETYPAYAHARSTARLVAPGRREPNGRPAGRGRGPGGYDDDWAGWDEPRQRHAYANGRSRAEERGRAPAERARANGNDRAYGHAASDGGNGNGNGNAAGYRGYGRDRMVDLGRYEDDWRTAVAEELAAYQDEPFRLVEDDVHIVVHRSDELDMSELDDLRTAGAR